MSGLSFLLLRRLLFIPPLLLFVPQCPDAGRSYSFVESSDVFSFFDVYFTVIGCKNFNLNIYFTILQTLNEVLLDPPFIPHVHPVIYFVLTGITIDDFDYPGNILREIERYTNCKTYYITKNLYINLRTLW